jgi:hypothetical protein
MTDDLVEPDPIPVGETSTPPGAPAPPTSSVPGEPPTPPPPTSGLEDLPAPPERTPKFGTGKLLVLAAIVFAVIVAGGVSAVLLFGGGASKDSTYLSQLKSAGLAGQFPSDANAIAHAKLVCTNLEAGGKQQGLQVDEIGVGVYCDKFTQGFHVLEVAEIKGTFSLIDTSPSTYYPAITSSGVGCSGSGGYSDIHSGTQVFLKNGKGDVLANGSLSSGVGGTRFCTFSFTMPITEGEDTYIVEVGKRGQLSYSFTELKNDGLALSLGD